MNHFDAEFERCSKWLQDALDHGGNSHDLKHVKAGILNGSYTFWPASNSAIVTVFIEYPNYKVLNMWLGGGELNQILEMIKSITEYAKNMQCKYVMCCGRGGWERALKKQGFKGIMRVCSKEIEE